MNTCRNCKHWDIERQKEHPRNFGVCRSSEIEHYTMLDIMFPKQSKVADAMAEIEGQFETGPEFGCVHFETK